LPQNTEKNLADPATRYEERPAQAGLFDSGKGDSDRRWLQQAIEK
jgi:hypothetical protein